MYICLITHLREHVCVGSWGIKAEAALAECQDPKGLTTYLAESGHGAAPPGYKPEGEVSSGVCVAS